MFMMWLTNVEIYMGVLISWLFRNGILEDYNVECQTICKSKLGLCKETSLKVDECTWGCGNKRGRFKFGIQRHSWIEKAHLSLAKIAKPLLVLFQC